MLAAQKWGLFQESPGMVSCFLEVDFSSPWHQIPATVVFWPFGSNHLLIFDLSGLLDSTSDLTQLCTHLGFSSGKSIAAFVLNTKDYDSLAVWPGEKVLNI